MLWCLVYVLLSIPLAFVMGGAVRTLWCYDCVDGEAAACCLYNERSGGVNCAHVGAVHRYAELLAPYNGQCAAPFVDVGDFFNSVCDTTQYALQSSSARSQCNVCVLTGDSSMLPTGVGVVIDMVLLHMVCMHHVPRLSSTRCLPCWCWKRL